LLRIAVTPDGSRAAVFDNRQVVTVYDIATRRAISSFPSQAGTLDGITPDGRQVVVFGHASTDQDGPDPVAVLDARTGRRVRVLVADADLSLPEPAMTADGSQLAVITTKSGPHGLVVDLFDARHWSAAPRTFTVLRPVALAAGRAAVAAERADGVVEVHNPSNGRLVATLRVPGTVPGPTAYLPLAVSPDGARVAVNDAAQSGRVTVLSVHGGRAVALPTQPDTVNAMSFSPDGRQLAVVSASGSVAVYSTADGKQTEALPGHSGPANAVTWTGTTTPTGLYSVGLDSQLVSWSVTSFPRLATQSGPDITSPDRGELFGHYVLGLTPQQEGPGSREQLYLADVETGHFSAWPLGLKDDDYVNQAVATPDGRLALISIQSQSSGSRVEVWDLQRHVRLRRLALPSGTERFLWGVQAALSRDGTTAYACLSTSRIGVFDVASGRYLRDFTVRFAGPDAQRIVDIPWLVAPDGKLLFGAYDAGPPQRGSPYSLGGDNRAPNHRLGLVDPSTGRLVAQVGLGDVLSVSAVAWSHDASLLAVGTLDGTVTLLDAHTFAVQGSAGTIEPGYVHTLSFSDDDRTLAEGGTSNAVNVLSVPGLGREGGRISFGAGSNASGAYAWFDSHDVLVGFAADRRSTDTAQERWFRLPMAPAALVTAACSLAGTDLSIAQWRQYVGDRPYQRVCQAR
jgi:WD40 repeat protein